MAAVQEQFVAEVLIPHDGAQCLVWPFARNSNGYGFLYRHSCRVLAHRVACEIAHGPAPTPKHEAAHLCGNGHLGCVSPRHLAWKTRAENAVDAITHGTIPRGERHGCVVLTERQARIAKALKGRVGSRRLAREFGVSRATISHIQSGRNWAWLNEDDNLADLEREARALAARIAAKKEARRAMK